MKIIIFLIDLYENGVNEKCIWNFKYFNSVLYCEFLFFFIYKCIGGFLVYKSCRSI